MYIEYISDMASNSTVPLNKKLVYSGTAALVFVLMSLPQAYAQTGRIVHTYDDSCPTPEGKYLHALLFFVINYFAVKFAESQKYIGLEKKSDAMIAKNAFIASLLFFVIASTDSYKLTGKLFGGLANKAGCPDVRGVVVHGIVFLVILTLVMYIPKDH
jgi:hypothetical protein